MSTPYVGPLVNLCPHPIAVRQQDGDIAILPKADRPARIKVTPGPKVGEVDGVAIHAPPIYGDVVNLPARKEGVIYIVSQLVALALASRGAQRTDVVFPGSGPHDNPLKDDKGRTLAVTRLVRTF